MRYQRIRDLREDHDLTQRQVADVLGMSQSGYSKYETGENDVPTPVLIRLSALYGTSVDYILEITDQKTPYRRTADQRRRDAEYRKRLQKLAASAASGRRRPSAGAEEKEDLL